MFESGRCTFQLVCDHVRIQKAPEGNLVTPHIYRDISEAHCSLVCFPARRMYRDATTAIVGVVWVQIGSDGTEYKSGGYEIFGIQGHWTRHLRHGHGDIVLSSTTIFNYTHA